MLTGTQVSKLATTLMNKRIALFENVRTSRLRNGIMPSGKGMKKEKGGTVGIKMCKSNGVELRLSSGLII